MNGQNPDLGQADLMGVASGNALKFKRALGAVGAESKVAIHADAWNGADNHDRQVVYFAHDWSDAATGRRVDGFQRDGYDVAGFAMHRRDIPAPQWVTCDLGRTFDNAYFGRLLSVFRGARLAGQRRKILADANVIVARNLDMLVVALLARRFAGLSTPVIYECLDIHRFMVRDDIVGHLFRNIEAKALKSVASVWVSSPAFAREYFEPVHGASSDIQLLENRFANAPGSRPGFESQAATDGKLRIGWFGNLRCNRTLSLLELIAEKYAGQVAIIIRGYPAEGEIPDFHQRVQNQPAFEFGGRYQWPDELQEIYASVDVVWAGDFMDSGKNSEWLLPNRLYEGGWHTCPPIAPENSETGRWIQHRKCGFSVPEPVEDNLSNLLGSIIQDPTILRTKRLALAKLPDSTFIEPENTLAGLIESVAQKAAMQSMA